MKKLKLQYIKPKIIVTKIKLSRFLSARPRHSPFANEETLLAMLIS